LARYVPNIGDYDRGFHCLVGEQEFRGEHRVKVWLSALVHYLWLADNRTETVMLEPRVDNDKYVLELLGSWNEVLIRGLQVGAVLSGCGILQRACRQLTA
jgi:hypothetical protein